MSDIGAAIGAMIGGIIPLYCMYCVFIGQKNAKKFKEETLIKKSQFLKRNNVSVTTQYSYFELIDYLVDTKHKEILLFDYDNFKKVAFKKILGCETIINNESAGGIGRAMIGGLIAGGSGAIVGAITAKKEISSFQVTIYIDDIKEPKFTFELARFNLIEENFNYEKAISFSQNVTASIKAIIAQNESKSKSKSKSEIEKENKQNNEINLEKRLKSLDNLLKKGLISDKEYNEKRSQLLNDL